jgi:hypothetical protein
MLAGTAAALDGLDRWGEGDVAGKMDHKPLLWMMVKRI